MPRFIPKDTIIVDIETESGPVSDEDWARLDELPEATLFFILRLVQQSARRSKERKD